MRYKLIISILLFLLFGVRPTLAIDSPTLISPQNNSTISSGPTFNWQGVSDSAGYNILIDDEPTVTSPYVKTPYYPNNPSYSPQNLDPGIYYWKVKAKDSSGNWGSFSSIWSFNLTTSTPSPSSTPTPNPIETSTPTPDPTSPPNSNIFIISNIPTQINSDKSFILSVNLTLPEKPNTNFYLKGAFKKSDGSNYFGLTKVGNEWIKNSSSYTNQLPITTDSSGNFSGNIEVMVDQSDSGYAKSGDYIFKVARYDPLAWSNEVTIQINNITTTQENPSNTPQPTTPITIKTLAPTITNPVAKLTAKIASVAGISKIATPSSKSVEASPSANIKVADQKNINPFIILGSLFVIIGLSSLGFVIYRKR